MAGASSERVLICGSVAFDTIMNFDGLFRDRIVPGRERASSVAFLAPRMRREYGGRAGNIAYNMRLVGDLGVPMATVGTDAQEYLRWMRAHEVPTDSITLIHGECTAQALILTDREDNKIAAFHPGAMNFSHLNRVESVCAVQLGVIAPDGRDGMLRHAEQFAAAGIPFLFDPGEGLPMFSGEELRNFVRLSSWIALNEHEWHLLSERTGLGVREVAKRVRALIVTRGAAGSIVYAGNQHFVIPPAKAHRIVDSRGCGDAYRAGILHGLINRFDWPSTGRIASLMGALKIEVRGAQNHRFARSEFYTRYQQNFGVRAELGAVRAARRQQSGHERLSGADRV